MSAVIALRKEHGERFTKRYGVKLGFMSFFVKAAIDALRQYPELNAEIQGEDQVVYHQAYHIGVAIGATKGLVVPVLNMRSGLASQKRSRQLRISASGQRKKLEPHELTGGTFTITNGASTGRCFPRRSSIRRKRRAGNALHSGAAHRQERPDWAAPMMYHRSDLRSPPHRRQTSRAVSKCIKETIEKPARMLVEV